MHRPRLHMRSFASNRLLAGPTSPESRSLDFEGIFLLLSDSKFDVLPGDQAIWNGKHFGVDERSIGVHCKI